MWLNPHFPADLVTFTEEILNGKLYFLCSAIHLSDEFKSKDNINFCNNYKAIICETFTLCIYFKGKNSANKKSFREWPSHQLL